MESFEARHSNHDLALAIAGGCIVTVDIQEFPVGCGLLGTAIATRDCCQLAEQIQPAPGRVFSWSANPCLTPLVLIAAEVGIERPSLRLDSQAKYGEPYLRFIARVLLVAAPAGTPRQQRQGGVQPLLVPTAAAAAYAGT